MFSNSHACREKCFRSEEFPAEGTGGTREEPKDPTAGQEEAARDPEESAGSPRRCWMECSWKQGSDRRTEAARDVLRRDETEEEEG